MTTKKLLWKFCLQCRTLLPLKPKKVKYCEICIIIRERKQNLSDYNAHEHHRSLMIPWQAEEEEILEKNLNRAKAQLLFGE